MLRSLVRDEEIMLLNQPTPQYYGMTVNVHNVGGKTGEVTGPLADDPAACQGRREWRVSTVHGVRNSLITVMTILGLQLGTLISGTVVNEQIFMASAN